MANYARISEGIVVDVTDDPAKFHPIIAAQFEKVAAAVEKDWRMEDGKLVAPPEPPEPKMPEAPAIPEQEV